MKKIRGRINFLSPYFRLFRIGESKSGLNFSETRVQDRINRGKTEIEINRSVG